MTNPKNLKSFKQGYDPRRKGNGRPKGSVSIVAKLKEELLKIPQGKRKTYLELLVKRILDKGIKSGDVSMIKDIINRVDGMPQNNLDLTTKGESLVEILHYANRKSNTTNSEADERMEE